MRAGADFRVGGRGVAAAAVTMAAVLGLLGLTTSCRGRVSDKPPIHLIHDMDQQSRFNPQSQNPFFADGMAMRAPVPGTIAQGQLHDDVPGLLDGRVDGEPLAAPPPAVTVDLALLARGRERYGVYCAPCHDSAGTGQGVIVAGGMLPPPSFHDPRLLAMPIGEVVHVIAAGIRNMPAYAGQLSAEERWAVAAYLRALQLSRAAGLEHVPPDVAAERGWKESP